MAIIQQHKLMKRNYLLVLIAMYTLSLLIACSDQRATGVSKDNDSTHTTAYINKISLQEPECALAIIDTMEINKEAKPYEINYLRLMVYINGSADKKLAEYYGKQVLKDSLELQKNPKEHISILNNLANIAYSNSQFTQGLKYAKTSVEVARKNHLELQEVVATHYMGLSALALGDTISGLKLLKEGMERIIRLVDGNNTLYDISQAYMLVCNYMVGLLTAQRYDEAGKLIPDLLFITKKAKEVGKTIDGMAELRQIYTASLLLEYYDLTGNTKEGEKYLAEIQKSKLAGTSSVEHIVANHYFNVKDVENLAQVTARLRESTVATGDTLTDLFLTNVLSFEKYICRERGNYREALEKAEAIISVKDSLAKRKNEQDGLQLAKIYDTQEKEKQIAEQETKLNKQKYVLIGVAVLLVIGAVFIVIVTRFNRRVNRRNKTIVATINQMMRKEGEITRLRLTDDAENVNPDEMRLMQSLEMLKDDKPNDEIVTQCGYRDANDFNRKFYEHFGIYAEEYRKWSKNIIKQEQPGDDEIKQMKDSFIKNMSHEIRTPLNQIFGFVQLLTDPNFQLSDEQKRRYNEIIGEQTNFMTRMLNKFLELSEYESSDEPLPKETVAIDDLFNEVNSIVPRPAEGVELTFHNNSGLAEVETNHKGLSRIIQCLVGNAVKFTAEGYISVECATNADGNTIFTVTDTGKGIPEGEEEKIFDRFYKVDDFVPGAGLGLPLVRVIARRMGATVELDRTYEAKGSRFRVSLRA